MYPFNLSTELVVGSGFSHRILYSVYQMMKLTKPFCAGLLVITPHPPHRPGIPPVPRSSSCF